MTQTARLWAAASVLAVAAGAATPAFAAGTTAGSTITNTVTVNYQVGGVAQNSVTANTSFTVDRKVNFTVAEEGNATTEVSPGQPAAVTTFIVSNTSNAPLDFALVATNRSGGTAAHGGTDNFDVTNLNIYVDTNNDGDYDAGAGGDQLITYVDQLAVDTNQRVFVVVDVPLGRSTNDVAGVRLTGTAAEATAAGSLGATVTQTSGANTAGVDTVFADTTADGNTARDGVHFDEDDYTVLAAALSVSKLNRVISDPLNGTTNPKLIPGAVVEYCIAARNAGGATATTVAVNDPLPRTGTATNDLLVVYEPTFGILVNGTATVDGSGVVTACAADGAAGGSHVGGTVTATIPSVAAGDTRTVLFRVTLPLTTPQ